MLGSSSLPDLYRRRKVVVPSNKGVPGIMSLAVRSSAVRSTDVALINTCVLRWHAAETDTVAATM
jgi:hypothetical protein